MLQVIAPDTVIESVNTSAIMGPMGVMQKIIK